MELQEIKIDDDKGNNISLLKNEHIDYDPNAEGWNLTWKNVNYEVPIKGKKGEFRKLLSDINGIAAAGRITAIMGPSGAGKSTFLDVLAGRIDSRKSKLEGEILVNGKERGKNWKGISGYVLQDDMLHGDLTVYQNLWYAAQFKLPNTLSKDEKEKRVNQLIAKMGLESCKDRPIGSAFRAGISGGQRKRLSVAITLLTEPKIIFLDEPTSGLDSKSSYEIILYLKNMAVEEKKVVICTIHQPSSQLFNLFDDLVLLSKGELCYGGPRSLAIDFFTNHDLKPPALTNPADHYMDVINYDFMTGEKKPQSVSNVIEGYKESAILKRIKEQIKHTESSEFQKRLDGFVTRKYANGWLWQVYILITRGFLIAIFNPAEYWARVAMYLLMAFFMGFTFFRIGYTQSDIFDRISALFFGVAFLTFMSIAAIPAFIAQRKIFIRERMMGYYKVSAYVFAQQIVQIPFTLLMAIAFVAPGYYIIGFRDKGIGLFLTILFLALNYTEGLMLIISAIVPSFIVGTAIGAATFGLFMCVMGFFIKISNLPRPWYYTVHWIACHKYAFESFMKNEFTGENYPCNNLTLPNGTPYCYCLFPDLNGDCILSGNEILKYYDYEGVKIWAWCICLIGIACIWRVIFWFLLSFLPGNKGKRIS